MLCLLLRAVQGYSWAEDKEHCEEYGRMLAADPSKVSQRAKKRGLPQVRRSGKGGHCPCACPPVLAPTRDCHPLCLVLLQCRATSLHVVQTLFVSA